MTKSIQEQIADLKNAIAAQENLRATVGDAVVDAAIAALRKRLADLETQETSAEPQRKQITVLFAAVSDLAAMAETVDAEVMNQVVNRLWRWLDQVIVEHGGKIDKHIGEVVMALWGAERAREDDPERAVRAALALQKEIRAWKAERYLGSTLPSLLSLRVGINTGLALLGEVGTTGEYTAIGDTVNTAERLERIASAGGILISHDTYRHVRGVFDVQVLDPIRVKGKTEPVQAYLVERAKPRAFRKGTRGVEGVETRMIGRDEELGRLQSAFYTVDQEERSQVVTIVGEAGVGKSRLLHEFDVWAELQSVSFYFFKGRASQEMQNLPYALIRDLLSFRFQIQDSDRASAVREKMERGVGEALGDTEQVQMYAHFIGQLLGFDLSDSPHLQGSLLDPRQIRDRALMYLGEYLGALSSRQLVLMLLEDLHWADDSSLDALNYLAVATSSRPVLIASTARPPLLERQPGWGEGQDFHVRLALQPLSTEDSRRLVEEILQKADQVPPALRELIVNGAEGNPFYVEELIKMLIEDGVIVKDEDRWQVEPTRLTAVRVPPTLTGVLQARLDSLPPHERGILQQASVVGRVFWDSAVARIGTSASLVDQPAPNQIGEMIWNSLATLQDKEMVFQRKASDFAGTQEYIFKHAILRQVTYESVLKRVRRVYHGLVADWLVEHGGERIGEYTGLIAEHLELAGKTEQAAHYLRRAGERAARQFANAEAVSYFSRALDLLSEASYVERYALLLARERVYDVLGAREDQAQDLAALKGLIDALDDDSSQASRWRAELALRQANYAQVTSDFSTAIAAAQVAIDQAQSAQDVGKEAAGRVQWALGLWRLGDLEACRSQLEQALSLARKTQARQLEADGLRYLGNVYYYQGSYGRATAYWGQSLDISRQIGDRRGEASTLGNLGEAARSQGEYAQARSFYQRRLQICREIGDREGENLVLMNVSLVSHNLGDHETALAYAQESLELTKEIGNRSHQGYIVTFWGYALEGLGRLSEAVEVFQQAVALRRELGEHHLAIESLAGLARVALVQGDWPQVRACAEEILDFLQDNTLDGTEEPLRVYWSCYRALRAVQDPRAGDILKAAHTLLQERANRIDDQELRRSFLQNVAAHREILEEFERTG